MVLPTDAGIWIVRGVATGDDDADAAAIQSVMGALETFRLADAAGDTRQSSGMQMAPEQWAPDDPQIILKRTLSINMIMVGQEWSSPDIAHILEGLPSHYDPVFTTTGDKVGVRYHYSYNFVSSEENTDELIRIMDKNSRVLPVLGSNIFDVDFWHAEWLEYHPDLHDKQYRLVDAAAVEEYVQDVIIGTNPDLTAGPSSTVNLVFFNIEPDRMDHIQNYYITEADRATGQKMDFVGLMGFGGASNTFFFDMWAVPWVDAVHEWAFRAPTYTDNLHDCWEPGCLSEIVRHHTESSIYHIVTPSFLYLVESYDRYVLDVLLYIMPGGRVTVTPATLNHFINSEEVQGELEYLHPFTEWDVELSLERRDLRGLSYEFKQQFSVVNRTQYEIFGETIQYKDLSSDILKPYLIEWAQERMADRQSASNGTLVIPLLVAVDTTDDEVRLDDGALGIAPGMPGNESLPCCALAVTDAEDVWESRIGLDNLILHEVGHVMGLHHTFASYKYGEPTYDFYFNWYSSPMTYSFPDSNACGWFYTLFYDAGPCGNAAASFTEFERERLADARTVSVLKKLDGRTDSMTADAARDVEAKVDGIKRTFAAGDTLSKTGALQSALEVYAEATSVADAAPDASEGPDVEAETEAPVAGSASESPSVEAETTAEDDVGVQNTESVLVPAWVKNSAGWWADGLIGDSEFVSSIEYMISQGIITIGTQAPAPDSSIQPQQQEGSIPAWVKNSAGWWADGLLDDKEFVSSIEYLVSNGLIRVG